jgi:uracil-DNA glycosylase
MNVRIDESWRQVLQPEFDKPYFELLTDFVRHAYRTTQCFPPAGQIFRAFDLCPFDKVRVVIIGQDPYHDVNQAHGLCFSVQDGIPAPPSLVNIYKELNRDLGKPIPTSGNLTHWAEQGVLLLNATLTVEAHKAGSHQGKGWEELTDAAIQALNKQRENIVFMLWGSYAQRKGKYIDRKKHLVLEAVHPSPLSAYRGFIGCGHFSQANNYLQQLGLAPIQW